MSQTISKYNSFKANIPKTIKLVAVSKTKSVEEILALYHAGHRIFGENKVQELTEKMPALPGDIEWHMIGHLQSNKVKYIAPFISMIHSVDSLKILKVINREAIKNNRIIPVLLQVHIAEEESKFGFHEAEIIQHTEEGAFSEFEGLKIRGLMAMASYTTDEEQVKGEFRRLKLLFQKLKEFPVFRSEDFSELSMGMSGDYQLALKEGATMIRIGSLIFGERSYQNK